MSDTRRDVAERHAIENVVEFLEGRAKHYEGLGNEGSSYALAYNRKAANAYRQAAALLRESEGREPDAWLLETDDGGVAALWGPGWDMSEAIVAGGRLVPLYRGTPSDNLAADPKLAEPAQNIPTDYSRASDSPTGEQP